MHSKTGVVDKYEYLYIQNEAWALAKGCYKTTAVLFDDPAQNEKHLRQQQYFGKLRVFIFCQTIHYHDRSTNRRSNAR